MLVAGLVIGIGAVQVSISKQGIMSPWRENENYALEIQTLTSHVHVLFKSPTCLIDQLENKSRGGSRIGLVMLSDN